MQLELISFKLCPFAQRAIISLTHQQHDFKMTYINPMDAPDWFKKISPTGQVPLLKVDDKVVFESLVITEFINEISPISFHPDDVIQRANNRSWIIFSGEMLGDLFGIVTGDEQQFNAAKKSLFAKLAKIETAKNTQPFFNGETFNMLDAAFAPLFMRLNWINKFTNNTLSIDEFTNLSAWQDNILSLDIVKSSVVAGLDDAYHSTIENREGFLASLLVD
jgi:glutathione S-transferase